MPKKLFAVTNVKINSEEGGFFPANTEIDASKLTKEQLVELHDAGAVEIRLVEDEVTPEPEPEQEQVETPTESSDENPPEDEN